MLSGLAVAIEALLDADVSGLDADCLHESVVGFRRLTSLLGAAEARFVDKWDADTVWKSDGSRSAAARLARDAHANPAVAGAVIKRARRLRTMPATTAAVRAGEVSMDHVAVLAEVNRPPYEDRFAEGEDHLVEVAKLPWFENFTRTVTYWKHAADDDASEKDAKQRYDERYLKARATLAGMIDIQGRLDPIGGAIVTGELDRLERQMFEADWAVAKEVHGLDTCVGHLARTADQRRADALIEMARRSAAMVPGSVKARTLLTIHVDHTTFADRICEMANGVIVTPGRVADLFTDSDGNLDETLDTERIVFGPKSRIIDVGVRTRLVTGGLRRAVEVRDRHCSFPGCTVPAERCEVDHTTEWSQGGQTVQENLRLLCGPHNRQRPGRQGPPTTGP